MGEKIVRDDASAIYRFATDERFLNFYSKFIESMVKEDGAWIKWHRFESDDQTIGFICPLAYTEYCFVNGRSQEALDCFNKMAEKPWEKKFVKMLEQYGENRESDYMVRKRVEILSV